MIVVDNGSNDGTAELVERRDDAVLLASGGNVGFGRGCNVGAEAAAGEWLLFVNPDVRLLALALPEHREGDRFGVGAGQVDDGRAGLESGLRAEPTLVEDWQREVIGRFLPRQVGALVPTRRHPPGWAYGALTLVRADEFRALGGFDERFFLYHEDRDLGARYRQEGMPIRDLPDVTGRHLKGRSVDGASGLAAEAWAFVSWIEYLSIWRGRQEAARTARRALGLLHRMTWIYGRIRSGQRANSKADSAEAISAHISACERHLPEAAASCYPAAREILRRVSG